MRSVGIGNRCYNAVVGPARPATATAPDGGPSRAHPPQRTRWFKWWWVVAFAIVVEFWSYGRRGHVRVCVGKSGETDFALEGEARTGDNRWKFPRCEQRENLGLRDRFGDVQRAALTAACRGATALRHRGEREACVESTDGWVQVVSTTHCPPWHRHYLNQLFWFLRRDAEG